MIRQTQLANNPRKRRNQPVESRFAIQGPEHRLQRSWSSILGLEGQVVEQIEAEELVLKLSHGTGFFDSRIDEGLEVERRGGFAAQFRAGEGDGIGYVWLVGGVRECLDLASSENTGGKTDKLGTSGKENTADLSK